MFSTNLLFVKVCRKGNDSLSNYDINYFRRLKITSWGPFSLHTDNLGWGDLLVYILITWGRPFSLHTDNLGETF